MSIKNLYSIYDETSEIYEPPFVDVNDGTAIRKLQDLMMNNPQSTYSKFPDCYHLHRVGKWDELTGTPSYEDHTVVSSFVELKPQMLKEDKHG